MEIQTDKNIGYVHCETAEECLGVLSPTSEILKEKKYYNWVFRGQSKANWSLKPAVFRNDGWKCFEESFKKKYLPSNSIYCEYLLVRHFVHGADRQGLQLSEDSMETRNSLFDQHTVPTEPLFKRGEWPNEKYWPYLVYAQHSGIPTRLLDWSSFSYVAAYFAVIGSFENEQKRSDDELAIWALNSRVVYEPYLIKMKLKTIRAPGGAHSNLGAQKGLFTMIKGNDHRALEEILNSFVPQLSENKNKQLLYKVTLPYSESSKLLRLLSGFGVDGSTLFPGIEGVKKFVEEQTLWDRHDHF